MEQSIRGTLSKEELKHLHPEDKERYASNLINEVLRKRTDGLAISDLEKITQLSRTTIEKHLERLIALQVAEKRVSGITARYTLVQRSPFEAEREFHTSGDIFYSVQMLNRDGTSYIYIQQKTLDEFRSVIVKGAITVPLSDTGAFLDELRVYAVAQENKFEPTQ
jgi:hypothetical protein